MEEIELDKLREVIKSKRYYLRRHTRKRMVERGIEREDIEEAILQGEILEQYSKDKPYPKCLVMGFVKEGKPLYVSCAFDTKNKEVYVITVHWMDPERWVDPWTRRR